MELPEDESIDKDVYDLVGDEVGPQKEGPAQDLDDSSRCFPESDDAGQEEDGWAGNEVDAESEVPAPGPVSSGSSELP
jgi:hypothetical protein